jgi:hypothetical protein
MFILVFFFVLFVCFFPAFSLVFALLSPVLPVSISLHALSCPQLPRAGVRGREAPGPRWRDRRRDRRADRPVCVARLAGRHCAPRRHGAARAAEALSQVGDRRRVAREPAGARDPRCRAPAALVRGAHALQVCRGRAPRAAVVEWPKSWWRQGLAFLFWWLGWGFFVWGLCLGPGQGRVGPARLVHVVPA